MSGEWRGGGDSVPDTTKIKLAGPMANAMALKHEVAIFFDIASINFSSVEADVLCRVNSIRNSGHHCPIRNPAFALEPDHS